MDDPALNLEGPALPHRAKERVIHADIAMRIICD